MGAGFLQHRYFTRRSPCLAFNDGGSVPKYGSFRQILHEFAGNISNQRLCETAFLYELGDLLLIPCAGFSPQDHRLGFRIVFKQPQDILWGSSDQRIAADADTGAHTKTRPFDHP